jgi:hypothetical protein
MVRVYVAGPITDESTLNTFQNLRKGIRVSAKLLKLGFAPYCQFLDYQFNFFEEYTPAEIYNYGLAWVPVCNAMLIFSSDWKKSPGTVVEYEEAQKHGIPVFFSMDDLLSWREAIL